MSSDMFSIVSKYHILGRCVIPSGGGRDGKSALIRWKRYQTVQPTDAKLETWERQLSPKVWAMPTGPVSKCFVIDCDTPEANAMMEAHGLKPHVRTSKGCHYYCKLPQWPICNGTRIAGGIDVRGQGGYVNFCGGNGRVGYELLRWPTEDSLIPFNKLPPELQKVLKPKPKTVKERILQEAVARAQPGNRNATGLWLACQLRDNGLTQTEAEALMRSYAAQVRDLGIELYTETEAINSLGQAYSRPARAPWHGTRSHQAQPDGFNLTDLGNAERLVNQYGSILHYCYERNKWLIWSGKAWEWDSGARITSLAKLTVRNIYHEAGDEPDEKRRKELADHAKRSESDHRLTAMINLARSERGIPVKVTELDTNPWLFNCLNGTLDLRTGQLLPHGKEDLLTILVLIEYHPEAQCPRWLAFLDRVTGGNMELAKYLQRAVGYSLTGDTKSQVLFFLYGLGNNGKSTFVTTIRKLTGEYGERVNTDLFMLKDKNMGGPKEALANLKGKRYVVASELEDGRRLAVSLVKDMTGGETIKADRKYEHEIEYQPTHKLWLVGNHKPVIADTTLSIWRRVKLIPFTVTIPDKEIDPDLPSKLEAELPGVLAWAIRGCLDWQRHGLREPDTVTTATAGYRHEQDVLGDFTEDCCAIEPLASIPKADLKDEYQTWCERNSVEPISQRTFKARLIEKGITEGKSGSIRYWKGITLKSLVPNGTQNVPDSNNNGTTGTEKSVNVYMKEKQKKFTETPVQNVPLSQKGYIPDYPTSPCPSCGGTDFWLREASQWGKAEWLCSRCYPRPEGSNG